MEGRVGVIGYRGHLGSRLVQSGFLPLDINLISEQSIREELEEKKPDVIINCASKSIGWCEGNPIGSHALIFGLENLLDLYQGKLIHISCDLFYNGFEGFYTEADDRCFFPTCTYAFGKYFQEQAIFQKRKKDYLIIRTSELYDKNTDQIKLLLDRIKRNRPIAGSSKKFFTPTYIPHLVLAIQELVKRNLDGIINIAGKDYITEEKFFELLCEYLNYPDFYKTGFSVNHSDIRLPKRIGLDTYKAENINLPIFSVEEGIKELCHDIN